MKKRMTVGRVVLTIVLTLIAIVALFLLVAAICAHCNGIGFVEQLKQWTEAILNWLNSKTPTTPSDPEVSIRPIMMLK